MATTLPCTFCDGAEPGDLMVTAMATGDTVIVGPSCRMTYGLVLAGVTPDIIDAVIGDVVGRMEAAQAPANPDPDDTDDSFVTGVTGGPSDSGQDRTPRMSAPEPGASAPADLDQPGRRRPRKSTDEPTQRRRTKATLAARKDSPRSSADTDG